MNNIERSHFDNNEVSPKEVLWEAVVNEVNHITNKVGTPIDHDIKDTVVVMMAHGFSTSQSCGGHPDVQHGTSYPWIEIYSDEPDNWKGDKSKEEAWKMENLKEQLRVINYLSDFYHDRKTPFGVQLCIQYVGAFGGFRIHSTSADTLPLLPPEQQKEQFNLYRQEMSDFSQFLKDKFFAE